MTMFVKKIPFRYVTSMGFCSSTAQSILKKGDILKEKRIYLDADVINYSKLSFDSNPLHFDSDIAKKAGFYDRLVPGMLVSSLFPRIIASRFPGAIYISQTLQFKTPVYIEEEIFGEVQAINIKELKNKYIAKFATKCFKKSGVVAVDGIAMAILPILSPEQLNSPSD